MQRMNPSLPQLPLGSQTVMRNAPSECIQVQETPHVVIRAAVYRDQWPGSWDELAKGPVRKLMETKAMSSIPTQDILDVWDRQFLAESLRKEEPTAANIFMVNARIQQQHAESLIQQSGTQGCYFEMRSPDGRHPHDSQQVIWLPKRSLSQKQQLQFKPARHHAPWPEVVTDTGCEWIIATLRKPCTTQTGGDLPQRP